MWSGETDGTVLVSTQSETYGEFFVTHLLRYSKYSLILCIHMYTNTYIVEKTKKGHRSQIKQIICFPPKKRTMTSGLSMSYSASFVQKMS